MKLIQKKTHTQNIAKANGIRLFASQSIVQSGMYRCRRAHKIHHSNNLSRADIHLGFVRRKWTSSSLVQFTLYPHQFAFFFVFSQPLFSFSLSLTRRPYLWCRAGNEISHLMSTHSRSLLTTLWFEEKLMYIKFIAAALLHGWLLDSLSCVLVHCACVPYEHT